MNTEQISNEVKETAIVATFTCPCRPGFQYKSKSALDAHKKTKMHLFFFKVNRPQEYSSIIKEVRESNRIIENKA